MRKYLAKSPKELLQPFLDEGSQITGWLLGVPYSEAKASCLREGPDFTTPGQHFVLGGKQKKQASPLLPSSRILFLSSLKKTDFEDDIAWEPL